MAALCSGISYGLSQQSCLSNENKELIFVKLTDSAYKAIEEYQKNQVSLLLKKKKPFIIIKLLWNENKDPFHRSIKCSCVCVRKLT